MTQEPKTKTAAQVQQELETANNEIRRRAAKQAAEMRAAKAKTAKLAAAELARGELLSPGDDDLVTCRVTRRGDGKISTGVHVGGLGEAHYVKDEEFIVARSIATGLKDGPDQVNPRDWVEITG